MRHSQWMENMLTTAKNTARLFKIGFTLARYDALFGLEAMEAPRMVTAVCKLAASGKYKKLRKGQRLAMALESLGPTFIKLGQALSTRTDLVGEEISKDLSNLQDKLPPFPFKIAKQSIEDEFEKPLNEIYKTFDEKAVAAASIAQVHFATTHDGREVAVKILRPGIASAFDADIALFYWLAEMAERRMPQWRRLKPVESVRTFGAALRFELDLRYEAAAATEFRDNLAEDGEIYVPEIDWAYTGEQVMTVERIYGIPVNDIPALKAAGRDLEKVVENASISFFKQVFRDGFFHADMHPGNVFVREDNTLAVVDFGIMGRIGKATQLYLAEMLWAFLSEDYRRVAEMHVEAGYVPKDTNIDLFAQANRAIAKPIFGKPLNEISIAKLLGQLFAVAETFQMETQPQLLMLQKTMMLAEGVGRQLNPNVNMWKTAEPLVKEWAIANLGPQAVFKRRLDEVNKSLMRLPALLEHADKFFNQVDTGGITLSEDTVRRMVGPQKSGNRQWIFFAWSALIMLGAILLFEVYQ